ncbi:hypothetical protein MTO96_031164 [Rhipicephalus appendiculatus]
MRRRLRTFLPASSENLLAQTPDFQELAAFERSQRQRQKRDYDRCHGLRGLPQQSEATDILIVELHKKGSFEEALPSPERTGSTPGKFLCCQIALISRCLREV